jgi:hypothetical protein
VVGIFVMAAMVVYVADTMRRQRTTTQSTIYRELALNVAKAGFEEGMSFFRVNSKGSYLLAYPAQCPTTQQWVSPWPDWPDAAFLPLATNTDFYDSISVATDLNAPTECAGGMIGDISLGQFTVVSGSTMVLQNSMLWGHYVIRRQNARNWSPGPNTFAAFTDPDACHDLSSIATQSALGSGTRWSIASRGYLCALPTGTSIVANSILANPAAYQGNCLLSAPLNYYNHQPFMLAQARVYGEIARVNFNLPAAAVLIQNASGLTLNTNGIIDGSDGGGYSYMYVSAGTASTGSGSMSGTNPTSWPSTSISTCFPGQTWGSLQAIATNLEVGSSNNVSSGQIVGYVGGASVLPVFDTGNVSFTAQVNQPAFYFLNQSISLTGSAGAVNVLNGIGLCIIEGNLTIPSSNNSSWAGVLYVSGNVVIDGPTEINGVLIAGGTITIGNASDVNKTQVAYNPSVITQIQDLLQDFTVDSSSIVNTLF